MTDVTPFEANISDEVLDDLQQRLSLTRWPEQEPCEGWAQGIPLAYTRELVDTG